MEINPKIGFSSIRTVLKDGLPIEEPTILHKFPAGMTAKDIDTTTIEKSLMESLSYIIKDRKHTDGKIGYFIEYASSEYLIKSK